ncbi:MAG: hypothetical protein KAR42_13720 [candidate division Zixibacteria bacterium]|nr:hypothetical protein [candidate division Zixibacteria bacterium]
MGNKNSLNCTICGSFNRYLSEIEHKIKEIKALGITVLSPKNTNALSTDGGFVRLQGDCNSNKEIEVLHLQAIERSDFIYIVNPHGYLGNSTIFEIGYAISRGIPVYSSDLPTEWILAQFVQQISDISEVTRKVTSVPLQNLPRKASLTDLQDYIQQMVLDRGYDNETLRDVVLLFVEEVGELAKATRKRIGLSNNAVNGDAIKWVSNELADCLIYILDIANLTETNLEKAFRSKEQHNQKRFLSKQKQFKKED